MTITAETANTSRAQRPWALKDLPPYRPVAKKLMLLTAKENAHLAEVQQVLRTDAAFTAEVLRLANSPLIGARGQISSVLQAVMMLGLERIKALATTLALRTFLTGGSPTDALQASWRYNLATAIVCEWLGRFVHLDADTCYTAGLVHDVGRLALQSACPDEYERVLARKADADGDLLQREKSVFGLDHCEAGGWILEQWEFPRELRDVALLHHRRPAAGSSGLLPVVYAGWRIADLLGFSALNEPVRGNISEITAVLPGKAGQQVIHSLDGLAEEVAVKVNAIECSLL